MRGRGRGRQSCGVIRRATTSRPPTAWRSSPAARGASAGRSSRSAGAPRLRRRRQLHPGPACGRRRRSRRCSPTTASRWRSVPTSPTSSTSSGCSPRRPRRSAASTSLVHAGRPDRLGSRWPTIDLREVRCLCSGPTCGARSSSTGRPRAGSVAEGRSSTCRVRSPARPAGPAGCAASKAAVEAITRVLAKELRARHHGQRCRPRVEDPGDPAAIADLVAFLVSGDGRSLNGQVIHVDGGTT